MKRLLSFALLLIALKSALAAPSLCLSRPIRYAHYEFGLLHAAGRGGIDEDIRRELERRSGCRFETSLRPRARIWMELERGELDMAGSGVQNATRDRFAWFAHYVLEDNQVLLGPRVPASVRSFEDFIADPSLRLGGVRSFSYSPLYDEQVQRLQALDRVVAVSDTQSLYRLFALGQFDAVIASPFLTQHYVRALKLQLPQRSEDWDPAPATPSGLVLARRSFKPEQAAGWQALVQEMLADGTVRRIVTRHLGDPIAADRATYKTPPR